MEPKEADDEIREVCQQVKELIQQQHPESFEIISYATQVVAGTNFFVKIRVTEEGQCIHARIFRALPHAGSGVTIHTIHPGKSLQDPLEYF